MRKEQSVSLVIPTRSWLIKGGRYSCHFHPPPKVKLIKRTERRFTATRTQTSDFFSAILTEVRSERKTWLNLHTQKKLTGARNKHSPQRGSKIPRSLHKSYCCLFLLNIFPVDISSQIHTRGRPVGSLVTLSHEKLEEI